MTFAYRDAARCPQKHGQLKAGNRVGVVFIIPEQGEVIVLGD